MKFKPLNLGFGAIVGDLHLEGRLSDDEKDRIVQALDKYSVLIFRGTRLNNSEYIEFGSSFGQLEDFALATKDASPSLRLSNLTSDGSIWSADDPMRRNMAADALWHTDNTYRPFRARYSVLLAKKAPKSGGATEFCDTRAAYDALSDATKEKLDGLVGLHSIIYSRALVGFTEWTEEQRAALHPVPQPLVFINPRTGRRSLYIASHIAEIIGWHTEEARTFVNELIEFATQPQFIYRHYWRTNDIVMWDNRATMHRRASYDDLKEVRELYTMRVIEKSDLYDPGARYDIH